MDIKQALLVKSLREDWFVIIKQQLAHIIKSVKIK